MPTDRALSDFVEYLYGLGYAPGTIRMYKARLGQALRWANAAGIDLIDPKASDLVALRGAFTESNSTLRQLRCALQHWWDSLGVHPHPPVKALRVPPKPRPQWRGLPDDVARSLAVTAYGWHPQGTVTLIGLYTGLRRAEIASMRWDRFSHDFKTYRVTGKGGVTDIVPVHPRLRGLLAPYRSPYVWLFPGGSRMHVSAATIWEWVREVAEAAGVEHRVTPHQLRHTIINRVLRQAAASGLDGLTVAQRFARHARIDTTQIYVAGATDDEVATVMESIDWLGPIAEVA